MDDTDLARHALGYLADHHVLSLATVGEQGPWASSVFYVNDGFRLYFLSSPRSRHCVNIAHDARVAATVNEDYSDWTQIKGLQLEGIASEVSQEERPRVIQLYGRKFPLVGNLEHAPSAIVEAIARVHWYEVTLRRLLWIDNAAGFGRRKEIALANS